MSRPTDNKKDNVIKVRIDEATYDRLSREAKNKGTTISGIIRLAISGFLKI